MNSNGLLRPGAHWTLTLCMVFALGSLLPQLALSGPARSMHSEWEARARCRTGQTAPTAVHSYVGVTSDLFVDGEHGNDANSGTAEAPFKTITHALAAVMATAAEPVTIHVAAATYSSSRNGESFPLNMKSWVSLVGEGAAETVLDAENSSITINISGVQDARLEGFTITGGNSINGGGIACSGSSMTVANNIITGNTGDLGAGIYCLGDSPIFQDNTIVRNTATGRLGFGGAIFMVNTSPHVIGNIMSENEGKKVGCIYSSESSPLIEDNTIASNIATGEAAMAGGIYIQGGSAVISGNVINDNAATSGSGLVGGIYVFAALGSIRDNEISGNSVSGDDGLAGGVYCFQCSPAISGNAFLGNSSSAVGAVYCLESSPQITGNVFDRNSGLVGGICAAAGSTPVVANNQIAENNGFGIACFPESGPKILNNLIVANRKSHFGAVGIWCWGSTAFISNCTIASNQGFGVVNYAEPPTIENCIIWGNGDELWNCDATFCCVQDPGDYGVGNIHGDPLFVPGPLGNYYLDPASSCIDAGNLSATDAGLSNYTTQADGSPDSAQVDIGFHYPVQ
ncbi:MAG: right-handed parallel beta-helix repeat-containing protein [Candidatus Coatesbacteria bacterium]|nr:right-handed parallel beta-helix repeat-containing protein [Candidatus Coatesbacteria bacterium]